MVAFNNTVSTDTIDNFVKIKSTRTEKPNVKLFISQSPVITKSKTTVIKKIERSCVEHREKKDRLMIVTENELEKFLATKPDKSILEKQHRISRRFILCK